MAFISVPWIRLLLLVTISATLLPETGGIHCYACEEETPPRVGGAQGRKHVEEYHHSFACTGSESNWNTFDCGTKGLHACETTTIKATRDGKPYQAKVRKCGHFSVVEDESGQCKDTIKDKIVTGEFDDLKNWEKSELCMCRGDKCNGKDMTKDVGLLDDKCYNCVEILKGSQAGLVDSGLPECPTGGWIENYLKKECKVGGGCQTLHIKACEGGVPYEARIRDCLDKKLVGSSYSDCVGASGEVAKKYPGLSSVKAQVCPCRGDKCNGKDVETDPGEGGGCREEPTQKPCSKGAIFGWTWSLGVVMAARSIF